MVRKLLLGIVLVAGTGCTPDPTPPNATEAAKTPSMESVPRPVARPGEVKLPDRLRLPSVEYVQAAGSWDERISVLPGLERARMESLNARYFGVLAFDSAEEQQQLIDAGVPMPEEWLAAAKMSDEELAQLAKAQSPKGSLFFADRQVERFIEAQQRFAGTGINGDFDKAVIDSRAQAFVYASQALAITRKPFAAYLYGSIGQQLYGEQEYTAAAITVARALGDQRAIDLAREFVRQRQWAKAPPLSFERTSSIESMMWRDIHRYRPL